jgi:hypothetical protein
MSANPYESPRAADHASAPVAAPALTLWIATQYVMLTSGGCALLGALLGLMIAVFVPDYYRTVFRLSDESLGGILSLGIVLGGLQGLFAGALIGVLIVGIYATYLVRLEKAKARPS